MRWDMAGRTAGAAARHSGLRHDCGVRRAFVAFAAMAIAACSAGSAPRPEGTATTPRSRSTSASAPTARAQATRFECADPIGRLAAPPADMHVFGGAIALFTAASSHVALQTSISGSAAPSQRLFAKAGLLVKSGAVAEIIVPPNWLGRLFVQWSSARTEHLAIGPCGNGNGTWLAFPGGYYVPRPECVDLIVRVAGIDHHLSVGIGRPCPGQQPPPQPTSP